MKKQGTIKTLTEHVSLEIEHNLKKLMKCLKNNSGIMVSRKYDAKESKRGLCG